MKAILLFSFTTTIICASFSVHAKIPHPTSDYPIPEVTCSCDATTCDLTWTDVGAPTYGADIEFEAEWIDELGVEMSSSAELELENWSCDGTTCSTSGDFIVPDVPFDADVSFLGKVKGFENGKDGRTSRDFVKSTGECLSTALL